MTTTPDLDAIERLVATRSDLWSQDAGSLTNQVIVLARAQQQRIAELEGQHKRVDQEPVKTQEPPNDNHAGKDG